MEQKRNWLERLTNRYLLIIRNEANFAEKTTFTFTYAKVILIGFLSFLIILGISLFLVKTILAQWFDPRYEEMQTTKKLLNLASSVDSLERQVERKEAFIENFKQVVEGENFTKGSENIRQEDSLNPSEASRRSTESNDNMTAIDSTFRREFEEGRASLLEVGARSPNKLDEIYFFSPISGIISAPYNPNKNHFGVDIVSKEDEPVKAVAKGTVFMSSWTQDAGYVMAIQHKSDIISVYKHNSTLMHEEGDFVDAGEAIAIIGNTGEYTTGPHLHFELWYAGNPINPEEFVSF